jgi:hypothetical protein
MISSSVICTHPEPTLVMPCAIFPWPTLCPPAAEVDSFSVQMSAGLRGFVSRLSGVRWELARKKVLKEEASPQSRRDSCQWTKTSVSMCLGWIFCFTGGKASGLPPEVTCSWAHFHWLSLFPFSPSLFFYCAFWDCLSNEPPALNLCLR